MSCEIQNDQISTDGVVKLRVAAASNMLIEAKATTSPDSHLKVMKRLVSLVTNQPGALEALKEQQNGQG